MLETSRGKKRGSDGNDSPQALNFHGCDDSAHLLSTYCVQALFILKTHSPLARPTLRLEKVEFREAKPLGQSPAQLSKGTDWIPGQLPLEPLSEQLFSAVRPRTPQTTLG